jgi:hypothetical protein
MANQINAGSQYDAEELAFLQAIDRFKRENRRPFPTWIEVLDVLRSLGYRKPGPAEGGGSRVT